MELLLPAQVDRILRYPRGKSARLARAGKLAHITLPDGQIRFHRLTIEELLTPRLTPPATTFPRLAPG